MLALVVLGLVWLRRRGWRHFAGVAVLGALVIYCLVPALISDIRGARLDAQYRAASFWPEDLSFEGSTIVLISPSARTCGPLCETLAARGDLTALYLVALPGEGAFAPLTAAALHNQDTRVMQVTPLSEGNTRARLEPAQLPEAADWIIVQDPQGRYSRTLADLDIDATAMAQFSRGLHIYAVPTGSLSAPLDLTATTRMLAGFRIDRPYFMPIFTNGRFAPDTTLYSDTLQGWLCSPDDSVQNESCPFLF